MVLLVLKLWLKPHQRQETAWVGRREKQSTGQLLKRKQYRLKKKALQKMRENLKIQRKTIPHKTPLLTISNKEHCIQKSQWGYKETTKDRTLPPRPPNHSNISFNSRWWKVLYKRSKTGRILCYWHKIPWYFSTKHQDKQTKKNLNEGPSKFSNLYLEITTLISLPLLLFFFISK